MSSMQQPPVAPQPGPSSYQPPREPNISARTLVTVVAVVFIVLIGIVLVLLLMSGGGNSPEGALKGFAGGVNSGDAKEAFDHTVLSLMPGYETQVTYLGSLLLVGDPHIDINSVREISNESMTSDQLEEAQDIINEVLAYVDIEVEDMTFVEYSMTMEYTSIGGGPQTLSGEMLCVKVDGTWYLAMLTFFDEF